MPVAPIVIMFAGLALMLLAAKFKEWHNLGIPGLLVGLALIVTGAVMYLRVSSSQEDFSWKGREAADYARASGIVLGRHLAQVAAGAIAVVIVDEVEPRDAVMRARLEGLREGLGNAVIVSAVAAPRYPEWPEDPNYSMPPERRLYLRRTGQAQAFDELLDENAACNLVISLIGLPEDVEKMWVWQKDPQSRPKFALLGCEVRTYLAAIQSGAICAAVTTKPKFEEDGAGGRPPADPQAAFDRRFLLLTPENVEAIAIEYRLGGPVGEEEPPASE